MIWLIISMLVVAYIIADHKKILMGLKLLWERIK